MVQTAETIFRDFETDGVPASGKHQPKKSEIRPWGARLEGLYSAAQAGGGLAYETKADLTADLAHDASQIAWVMEDTTAANNGIYAKVGADGAGSWNRLGDLPYSYIKASNAGAGTANAIVATTSIPIPAADGGALIALPIVADNTGSPVTVSFNGGAALTVKTSSGNDVSVGGLTAGMIVAGYVSGATFRLLTDQASAAVVADAEAAADRAEAAADSLNLPTITADTFLRANADATGYDALSTAEAWAALANESAFAQPKSIPPKFWPNVHPGAKIHRMNDRVLIGAATDNSGETPATSSEDWLETLRTSTTKNSQLAVLSTIGQTAIIGGSRTSDFSQAGSQGCIAGSFWALNDNAVDVQSAYAAYMEAHREAGAGTTHGFELDTVNFGDLVTIHPYLMFSTGLTSGAWLAAGGGTAWPGAGDCSAAVAILANSDSARWEKGIVFHAAGLVGTDGDGTGSAVAIEMARGHAVRWLFTGGSQGASISSNVSNTAATQQIQFSDLGTLFRNAAGKNMFQIGIGSSVVNGVKVTPANTGVGPVVGAIGDDTNIDLGLAPKGTGLVRLTGQDSVLTTTPASFSATRYIRVKDDAGNVLYIPCTGAAW